MVRCLIRTCTITSTLRARDARISLHAFPSSLDNIKRWLLSTGQVFRDLDAYVARIKEGKTSDSFRVCSAHFKPEDYYVSLNEKKLRRDAVPSIFVHVPGVPLITEDVKRRPGIRKRISLRKSKIPKQMSKSKETAPLMVQAGTQTDPPFVDPATFPKKPDSVPHNSRTLFSDKSYFYLISTPVKLVEGTVSFKDSSNILGVPIAMEDARPMTAPEQIRATVSLCSPSKQSLEEPQVKQECLSSNETLSVLVPKEEETEMAIDASVETKIKIEST